MKNKCKERNASKIYFERRRTETKKNHPSGHGRYPIGFDHYSVPAEIRRGRGGAEGSRRGAASRGPTPEGGPQHGGALRPGINIPWVRHGGVPLSRAPHPPRLSGAPVCLFHTQRSNMAGSRSHTGFG